MPDEELHPFRGRRFAAVVEVVNQRATIEEIMDALVRQAVLCGKLVDNVETDQKLVSITHADTGNNLIGVSFCADDWLFMGAPFTQFIFDLCNPTDMIDGNEFLCCMEPQRKDGPADAIYPMLLISDDGGKKWQDAGSIVFHAKAAVLN